MSGKNSEDINIVLVTVDCLRADRVVEKLTPNISAFSSESLVYTQAISQGASTPFSFPAMFASRYYPEILALESSLSESDTLPTILKKNGYDMAAFIGANPQLICWKEYFDTWYNGDLNKDYSSIMTKMLKKLTQLYKYVFFKPSSPTAGDLNTHVSRWINERTDKSKFFLWIHYMDLHTPRIPPKNFTEDVGAIGKRVALLHQLYRGYFDKFVNSNRICDIEIKLYDSAVKYVDCEIGKLLSILKKENIYENSIVVLTSDHGEEFYHNKCSGLPHARMYDEVIHVPLIIKSPSVKNNGVIRNQVRLLDIAPTLVDIIGIEEPESFKGSSLVTTEIKNRIAYSYCDATPTKSYACIRTPEYKLIITYLNRQEIKKEFYDLKSDPEELKNIEESSKIKESLEKKLSEHVNQMSKKQKVFFQEDDYSEKVKDRLRQLGYTD